jgi:hypothetical protein
VKSEEINRDCLQLIELGESLHAIFMVDNATGFAATVHSEDGIAHIHTLQWDGIYLLGFPNSEVKKSLYETILPVLTSEAEQ